MSTGKKDGAKKGMKIRGAEFARFGKPAKYATLIFIFVIFVCTLFTDDFAFAILCGMVAFAGAIAFMLYMPKMLARKRAQVIERDLPFALMTMSVELNINVPFEKVLENVAKENYGVLSEEFARAVREVKERGASIQEALFAMGERVDSLMLKRSIAQLAGIYGHGYGGDAVRKIAIEQLAKQRAVSKEFSGKLVVFSLMFIAVSAIVPALFLAFVVVGSTFMEMDFTALQVLLIAAIGFPLVDLGMLFWIRNSTPVFLRGN
ncbi:type II secretion system F family protein [Candidatus Micrarchaeota archaeon]|nr:type II secretion system F family protein [Candidatus Micrarchaeota archaeon]MBU1940084.1 type II secretion system F family protein [Candidatus Micrarchaeota archaeon]